MSQQQKVVKPSTEDSQASKLTPIQMTDAEKLISKLFVLRHMFSSELSGSKKHTHLGEQR